MARLRLDSRGMREMLQSAPVAAAVRLRAEAVAAAVRAHQSVRRHDMPIETDAYTTDRAAVAVTIAHAGGLAVEAKYGALTDAAGAAGLDVTEHRE